MTPELFKERWHQFESQGAEFSKPIRRFWSKDGIPFYVGGLYVALYPKVDFQNLIDFNLYQYYCSSAQQDVIAYGALDADSFFPESAEKGTGRFCAQLQDFEKRKNAGDIHRFLGGLQLPKEAEWALELDFEEWEVTASDGSLELTASAKQGYLTVFIVDDGR